MNASRDGMQLIHTFILLQGDVALGLAVLCNSCKVVAMLLGYDDDMSPAKLASPVSHWLHRLWLQHAKHMSVPTGSCCGASLLQLTCARGIWLF